MSKQTSSSTATIRWYWANDDATKWMPYGSELESTLEQRFMADSRDFVYVDIGGRTYEFNYSTMKQRNVQTGTSREIIRHPNSHSTSSSSATSSYQQAARYARKRRATDDSSTDCYHQEADNCDNTVPTTSRSSSSQPRLVQLSKHDNVFTTVARKFYETMPREDFKIFAISEVKNDASWKKYSEKKGDMERISLGSSNEQQLFHGTVDYDTVCCIYNQNFDPRVHGKHGTKYGKGAYFSLTANFSHDYTKPSTVNGSRYMFLARVLVGQWEVGRENFQRPPPVDDTRPHGTLYDSCVDDCANPSIFVVFDSSQCVPEYLIEYD